MKIFLALLCMLFAGTAGVFGWLYFQGERQLNETADRALRQAADLQANITELQGRLENQQANAAIVSSNLIAEKEKNINLSGQLAIEQNKRAGLEIQLAAYVSGGTTLDNLLSQLQKDLDTSRTVIAGLTRDLNASSARVATIENDLKAAQAKVTTLQASLDNANIGLAQIEALKASNTALSAELKKIKDPRHFTSITELNAWLAKDDTNTNPAYISLTLSEKAFVLQVKALRDGYLIPAGLDADSQYIYSWNAAVAGGVLYIINASDDTVTQLTMFPVPPATHPMPLA